MRLRALALVSVALFAVLAGCGDDGGDDSPEAQTFCGVVDPIQQLPTVLENYEDVDGVDYDYAQLSDADAEAVAALTEPEFTTAADNIQAWSSDNCD